MGSCGDSENLCTGAKSFNFLNQTERRKKNFSIAKMCKKKKQKKTKRTESVLKKFPLFPPNSILHLLINSRFYTPRV